ncbi:MAG TPA: alpha-ketoacid dehydrogenase subunit beta [Conexibacter sp.]|nr:alpha-ketoacid dehydrogenase subunit beta [Conexibacter sp.]
MSFRALERAGVERAADTAVTMVEALQQALDDALERDPQVLLLGEDIGRNGGVFRVTDGLQLRHGAQRVLDMPIAEAGTVGLAVGLCLAGYRPVVEIQFDSFSYPALEQIATHVARYRWRTNGAVAMRMVIRLPFGGGVRAPELHSDSPEALFCHLPGLRVLCPSTPADAFELLGWAIASDDPVIFMEPKRLYRGTRMPLPGAQPGEGPPGARIVCSGTDVTLVSYGASVPTCAAAAEALAAEGISIELVDLRSLWPLDSETVLDSVRRTHRCLIVHEAPQSCGVGAELAALVGEHALHDLHAPPLRVVGPDAPFPLFALEDDYLPSAERVATAARRLVGF